MKTIVIDLNNQPLVVTYALNGTYHHPTALDPEDFVEIVIVSKHPGIDHKAIIEEIQKHEQI